MLQSNLVLLLSAMGTTLAMTQQVKVAGTDALITSSAVSAAPAVTCSQGQYLTYAIKTSPVSGVTLSQAISYFNAWQKDAPGLHISSAGSGQVGSTRVFNATNSALKATASVKETLTAVLPPSSSTTNLEQRWQSSAPESYYSGSLVFYAAYKDLTVSQAQGQSVSLQYYLNVCANSQSLANQALPIILSDSITYWINALKNNSPVSSSTISTSVRSSSARSSSSARPSSTTSLPPANPTSTSITCKTGQSLTYSSKVVMDNGKSLAAVQASLRNWAAVAPGAHVSSSGSTAVGATRRWSVTDSALQATAPINEILTAVIAPSSGNSNLEQRWQITTSESYYNGQLVLYQAFHDLTIGENSAGVPFLQYYINACANSQSLALKALPTIIGDALAYWIALA